MPEYLEDSRFLILPYDREQAVAYAHKWANGRNPRYLDFENYGGDCTNFASQCIFAGSGIMNHSNVYGWYYYDSYSRSASWTGVNFLYNFLINNMEEGPFAKLVEAHEAMPGDIAQMSFDSKYVYNHSPVIIETGDPPAPDNIKIAAHTFNADYYPMLELEPSYVRYIHILGVRQGK